MTNLDKTIALAGKIASKAEDALSGLEREMAIMQWPPEFRAIVWGAVAKAALRREAEADAVRKQESGA